MKEALQLADDSEGQRNVLAATFSWAVQHGRWRLAEDCLVLGHSIDPVEDYEPGELYESFNDFSDELPYVFQWLLEHGAEVDRRGHSGLTPLMCAVARGWLRVAGVLLAHGADVNAGTVIDDDYTALMQAAYHGDQPAVEFLLAAGADRSRGDRLGRNAAEIAKRRGRPDLARFIREWNRWKR